MNNILNILVAIFIFQTTSVVAQDQLKTNHLGFKYYEEAKFEKGEINKAFYYIRHGETDSNKYGIEPENLINNEVPLNELGISQITKSAKVLKDKNIKLIIASPMLRTKQTADIINKELNVPIIYHEGLIEARRGFVKGENTKKSKKKEIWLNGDEIEGAENLNLFQKRVHDTIKEIVNKYDHILIVGHGVYFKNISLLLSDDYISPKNGEIFYLTPNEGDDKKGLYHINRLN